MAYFQIDNMELYYEVHGDPDGTETVAFLNGVMASTSSWSLLWPVFARAGFRVLLHDFKGQLKSSKPEGPYTFAQHCAEAKALFASLGVEKLHLIGTSYGGEAAMKFAILYPEMVKSLTVIDSVSELDPVLEGFVAGWKTLCDTGDGEVFFQGMAPSIYGGAYIAANREKLAGRARAIRNNPSGYLEGQKILYDAFLQDVAMTDELSGIQCPALVVCGEEDILKPPRFSKIIADHIPRAEYLTLPGCGHVAIFEKPGELESAIFGFVMKNCAPFAG
ncbi:putative hydrolase or acyltransferase of alpha/beta superfamily [uncultured Eubacteriales bacterium]|uniref:Putative hydrolase or acyltransferase of alpha/beta superfamily n=1 Tax=uncultured Eubacteriales bacterium TaxID=172733 RepID=A0A212KCS7_9FIRM|nr:putative hydrolase or acyltransferase of alpha/beta superfamily [uncultured Eubacteriales bacterium]